jgi:hypothetical protein
MPQHLGAKNRRERGMYREGENARTDQIEPAFYAILKEEGCATDRRLDGTYYDPQAQAAWDRYQGMQAA